VALFVFEMALRWAAVRCDVLSLLITFSTFFFTAVVPKDVLSTSMAALALTYAVAVSTCALTYAVAVSTCALVCSFYVKA